MEVVEQSMRSTQTGAGSVDRATGEEAFHDHWAGAEDVGRIDVRQANEAVTAPELRHIHRQLGDLRGRRVLDVGCGRGETSVYFAMQGAEVTAVDLSSGMLELASALASRNGVKLRTHKALERSLGLPAGERFDVIHAGNVLHHVSIREALPGLLSHLAPQGAFVSWDPVAYNPAINIYRRRAMQVRTVDEHPLRREDVRFITQHFREVEVRFFWLTTLLIFIWMAVGQRRDPNRERYWKVVVDEADRWAGWHRPLARLDALLLRVCPPLRWWCWNVVIVGRGLHQPGGGSHE